MGISRLGQAIFATLFRIFFIIKSAIDAEGSDCHFRTFFVINEPVSAEFSKLAPAIATTTTTANNNYLFYLRRNSVNSISAADGSLPTTASPLSPKPARTATTTTTITSFGNDDSANDSNSSSGLWCFCIKLHNLCGGKSRKSYYYAETNVSQQDAWPVFKAKLRRVWKTFKIGFFPLFLSILLLSVTGSLNFFVTNPLAKRRRPHGFILRDILFEVLPFLNDKISQSLVDILLFVQCGITLLFFTFAHHLRFAILRRTAFIWGIVLGMRCLTTISTALPDPSPACQDLNYKGPCGDLIFSGHTLLYVTCAYIWHYYCTALPLILLNWCLAGAGILLIIMTHFHYTVDCLLGFLIASLAWKMTMPYCRVEALHQRYRILRWFERDALYIRSSSKDLLNEFEVQDLSSIVVKKEAEGDNSNKLPGIPNGGDPIVYGAMKTITEQGAAIVSSGSTTVYYGSATPAVASSPPAKKSDPREHAVMSSIPTTPNSPSYHDGGGSGGGRLVWYRCHEYVERKRQALLKQQSQRQ